MTSKSASTIPKDVIIIGGSLSSLMNALTLHSLGCSVLILEKSPTHTPPSHMAGIAIGPDVLTLLSRFDRAAHIPLGIPSQALQSPDTNGCLRPFLRLPRLMTSWDALYFRLRANFDGLRSGYVVDPPGPEAQGGEGVESARNRARYEIGKRVVGVENAKDGTGRVCVTVQDSCCEGQGEEAEIQHEYTLTADLVLGADGANSIVRNTFLGPRDPERRYAGYLAWRGVVPENQVSETTRSLFSHNITYSFAAKGAHAIVYYIPGPTGSIEPGSRLLNFCLYTNEPPSSLDAIMTDTCGTRHRVSVAPEHLNPSIWAHRRSKVRTSLPAPFIEIMNQITSPFVHLITDFYSPRAAFLDGKVLLVGDASALLRPHNAYAASQAARQAGITERLVKGEIGWREWEERVTRGTYLHWRQSVWFGEFYQRGWLGGLGSAVRYWLVVGGEMLRGWMGWISGYDV
ncbi:FAD/NAD(P)-binding domain-containing protein [Aspergillus steynii IBT 23096]|uniref:FAD/NAD(P)-binding domain-containing protein n=1 Tax=Aspergillus steynii IBT 23096 TaxID=1392250 RepID=A0A2I2GPW3_9EURO|nr:FAD/NAD(P)-binding domain-containing protein [Aspergillus steynii IBT 23096]PLB54918.1 FAD/NAD(P)-binding domain-containing protein [Aspergillus steynii IBT 23096]